MAKVQKEDPEESIYYKWSPAEWKFDSIENKRLDQLSNQLSDFSVELEGNDFEKHISNLFDKCLNVLLTLKKEAIFDDFYEKFVLLFDVSDYEDKEKQIYWVKELNNESDAGEFENWLRSDDN